MKTAPVISCHKKEEYLPGRVFNLLCSIELTVPLS
jgi:hypothetical protein